MAEKAKNKKAKTGRSLAQLEFEFPGTLSQTGLDLPKMDIAVWAPLGYRLSKLHSAIVWATGDWLCHGERSYGEPYAQGASDSGFTESTLIRYKRVSERVDPIRRRPQLSWSHHQEVAKVPPEEQEVWLQRAIDKGWSVAELHEAMRKKGHREANKGKTDDDALQMCPVCGENPCSEEVCGPCLKAISHVETQPLTGVELNLLSWALDYIEEPAQSFFDNPQARKKWRANYDKMVETVRGAKKSKSNGKGTVVHAAK